MSIRVAEQWRKFAAAPESKHKTFSGDFLKAAVAKLTSLSDITFPCVQYQSDPVAFCRDILGVEPWSKQIEILEAARDHHRVAVSSGHKTGKSHSAACLVLWYYCSFPDARVVMTSTTARQVDDILWRELRMVHARSGICAECKALNKTLPRRDQIQRPCQHSAIIPEDPADRSSTGLSSPDFRKVTGATAKQPEAVAGVSGYNLLYVVDEASGVPEIIFQAMQGNMAGGGRMVMFSNPTKCDGEFFDAFHSKKDHYYTIKMSSRSTPNCIEGRTVIPGLCERHYVEEKLAEWGESSPIFRVRIEGEFPTHEEGRIFSLSDITEAEQRWNDADASGRLYIGLDPAGPKGTGDDAVLFPVKGNRALPPITKLGLSNERYIEEILGIIRKENNDGQELPVVVMDMLGPIGNELYYFIRGFLDRSPIQHFVLRGVRSSDGARRTPMVYDRVRDELTACLSSWLQGGGALPAHGKLAAELHAMEWRQQPNGKVKVSPKDEVKKILGRSPDHYDALCLAVWGPGDTVELPVDTNGDVVRNNSMSHTGIDPYATSGIQY